MYPTTNLQPGQSGPEVKKLQDFLVSQGYMTQEQVNTGYGTYGPQTTNAVKAWQQANGVDNTTGPGYWGPRSIAAASKTTSSPAPAGAPTKATVTQADIDKLNAEIAAEAKNNPITSALMAKGNTAEDLLYATSTGDLSKLTDFTGQPFSLKDQQDAMAQAEKDLEAYYKAEEAKDVADTEAALDEKKRLFQESLVTAGESFGKEKSALDQTAANQGVLFSGSRAQREQDLKTKYEREEASKRAGLASDIGNTAREFQYKYGNDAASKLSNFYNVGSNVYNPKVATGGVTTGALSTLYNPGNYNFQGTQLATKKTEAAKRAAGLLANKGNKLLATGYTNQL
jgi:peptidoglycan hydrolase-like protein with peptidoglycan-binding domain